MSGGATRAPTRNDAHVGRVQLPMDCTREIPARRRISVTFAGTIVLLAAFAPTAFAECMNWPLEATKQPRIAFAFVATVTDIERHEMFEAGSGEFRYRITLETVRVYRGRIRESVELTGTNSGCSFLDKSGLAEGERLFIASERLRPDAHETDLGNVLAWKRTGSQWMFYEDALRDGSDETYYARAARAATTTAEIVQLVSGAPMPDTATAPPNERLRSDSLAGLALVFVVAVVVATRLVARRVGWDSP